MDNRIVQYRELDKIIKLSKQRIGDFEVYVRESQDVNTTSSGDAGITSSGGTAGFKHIEVFNRG